jgi:phage shock protein A
MTLLERVTVLLRANVNDLLDRAEDPEKTMKQLVLDMENQLLQLKTQVAGAMAEQHMLERKKHEHEAQVDDWKSKAEVAMVRKREDLARTALERSLSHAEMAKNFTAQLDHQTVETESLRSSFLRLQQKLKETQAECELLLAQHRRARALERAQRTGSSAALAGDQRLRSVRRRVQEQEVKNLAVSNISRVDSNEEALERLERDEKVEALLEDIRKKQARTLPLG